MRFQFAHTNALDRSEMRLASTVKVYCCILWWQALQEGFGGCTGSPCEQLRGSAALCWEMLAEPSQEAVLGEELDLPVCSGLGLCTQTLRAACTKADTLLLSPPRRCCRKRPHAKGRWCRSSLGASQQPRRSSCVPALSTSCRSQLSPHRSVPLAPALLPACNAVLLSQQPSGRRAEHLPHRTGKEPTRRATARPPRVTSQHVDAQRCLSKDPRHFLAAWGFFFLIVAPCHQAALCSPDLRKALATSGCNCAKRQVRKSRSRSVRGCARPQPRVSAGLRQPPGSRSG